jgi:hypothetical protein
MSQEVKIMLVSVALVAGVLVLRFVLKVLLNKGANAIGNALVDKKNAKSSHEAENLSDKHRK